MKPGHCYVLSAVFGIASIGFLGKMALEAHGTLSGYDMQELQSAPAYSQATDLVMGSSLAVAAVFTYLCGAKKREQQELDSRYPRLRRPVLDTPDGEGPSCEV